eukprot:scaffold1112_cov106-Cylindrotheca_fusiformis.AAC.3
MSNNLEIIGGVVARHQSVAKTEGAKEMVVATWRDDGLPVHALMSETGMMIWEVLSRKQNGYLGDAFNGPTPPLSVCYLARVWRIVVPRPS